MIISDLARSRCNQTDASRIQRSQKVLHAAWQTANVRLCATPRDRRMGWQTRINILMAISREIFRIINAKIREKWTRGDKRFRNERREVKIFSQRLSLRKRFNNFLCESVVFLCLVCKRGIVNI